MVGNGYSGLRLVCLAPSLCCRPLLCGLWELGQGPRRTPLPHTPPPSGPSRRGAKDQLLGHPRPCCCLTTACPGVMAGPRLRHLHVGESPWPPCLGHGKDARRPRTAGVAGGRHGVRGALTEPPAPQGSRASVGFGGEKTTLIPMKPAPCLSASSLWMQDLCLPSRETVPHAFLSLTLSPDRNGGRSRSPRTDET